MDFLRAQRPLPTTPKCRGFPLPHPTELSAPQTGPALRLHGAVPSLSPALINMILKEQWDVSSPWAPAPLLQSSHGVSVISDTSQLFLLLPSNRLLTTAALTYGCETGSENSQKNSCKMWFLQRKRCGFTFWSLISGKAFLSRCCVIDAQLLSCFCINLDTRERVFH